MDQHSKLHFVEGLAATHGSQLVRFFVSRLRDATEAHDLAQEVFLRLLRLERPDLVRQPEAYLFTVAANIVRETALKRSARPLQVTLEDTPNEQLNNADFFTANSPEESAQQQTRILELERTLATLSPKARAALIWHRRDDTSVPRTVALASARTMSSAAASRRCPAILAALDATFSATAWLADPPWAIDLEPEVPHPYGEVEVSPCSMRTLEMSRPSTPATN
jgi:RNA polymerase sigma-70 factor (ECF subfamily)